MRCRWWRTRSSPNRKSTSRSARACCTRLSWASFDEEQVYRFSDALDGCVLFQPVVRAVFGVRQIQMVQADGDVAARRLDGVEEFVGGQSGGLHERRAKVGDGQGAHVPFLE